MRLPRDIDGLDLARGLSRIGYTITRQTGSHIRLTLADEPQHHITIPAHQPLKVGTLAAILSDVGARLQIGRDALLDRLKL